MMNSKDRDGIFAIPERVELGCQTRGQCFCTGRCRRTAEEQAAYERFQASNTLGRQEFEPKPGHGSTEDAVRELIASNPTGSKFPDTEIGKLAAIRFHGRDAYTGPMTPDDIPAPAAPSALDTQVGGDHYQKLGEFQPWNVLKSWLTPEEFRGYMKGTAIAYLARERDKGGDQDVAKAAHTLQGLVEMLDGNAK